VSLCENVYMSMCMHVCVYMHISCACLSLSLSHSHNFSLLQHTRGRLTGTPYDPSDPVVGVSGTYISNNTHIYIHIHIHIHTHTLFTHLTCTHTYFVAGIDLLYPTFEKLVMATASNCGTQNSRCFLIDSSGFFVTHTSFSTQV